MRRGLNFKRYRRGKIFKSKVRVLTIVKDLTYKAEYKLYL